ncbi:RNA methyltransferase [Nonlabens sp. Ci31]|jgi:TrmH family RNA methyltransferase|uniref:TrmH family RNA methyltransferase n=1 Tax=Nonlabens sp. Ci31 TaxID=2608253 RepID=UPI001463288B|nr:RNA methyltransferase [Nonlabens sp. Ci31]QJP34249.1 RNA methyltransferase [Nonlabens sp. Ci31]
MITKSKLKLIKSLHRKKIREEHQLFIVEGYKSIRELLNSGLIAADILIVSGNHQLDAIEPEIISAKDMNILSNLKTAPGYLAVFKMNKKQELPKTGKIIVLDDVKDPGNLGTIIRLADWFGIEHIVCSMETVDVYNSKSVQASMASLARVQIHYTNLKEYLSNSLLPIFPTAMGGTSIYTATLPEQGIIIMGNESHGISEDLLATGTPISIPQYGKLQNTESLNVAMATSVILGEWLRSSSI